MKVLASLGLAAACLMASPALAGPAGTGLTFTQEVAKKALQKRAADAAASSGQSAPKVDESSRPEGTAKQEGVASDTRRAS
jgi:hypothetical protein